MDIYYLPRASNSLLKILLNLQNIFRDFKNMFISFPANICYTFPLASLYSNFKVSFYDIDYNTLYPLNLRDIISFYPKNSLILLIIVIPYGNFESKKMLTLEEEINKISKSIRQDNKLVLILWDMALVMITKEVINFILDNSDLFKQDFFVFSFSYAKQLELGYGSLLISPFKLDTNLKLQINKDNIPKLINKVDKIFKGSNIFYSQDKQNKIQILNKILNNKNVFYCYNSELDLSTALELDNLINKILNNIDFEIKLRNEFSISYFSLLNLKRNINLYYSLNLKELAKELNSSNMYLELIDNNLFSWRFNIRVNFDRDRLLKKLFDNGVFVSRLFPVVANLFLIDPIFKSSFNNSSKHWLKVINVFNNHLVINNNFLSKNNIYLNSNYIEKFVEVIGNFVKEI
jgi:hypothetical protein